MWDPYRIPVGTGKALVRPDRGGAAPRGLGTSGQRRLAGDAGPSYASLRDPRGRARGGDRGRRARRAARRLRGLGAARLRPPVRAQRALPCLLHAARRDARHRRALGGRGRRAERGLETERLLARLAAAETNGEALLLLGVTAAFAQLFQACRARGRAFRLGPASRVVDTGGQKGLTRPLSRPAFLRECWTLLGIPGYYCVNEYGMTELCSQRYDSALDDRFHGRSLAPRRLAGPPWLRTRVLDPDTLAPVAPGASGLLCHHDLANAGSVSVVLSEDLGRAVGDDGIEVSGRVPGAVPRGCGLLLADLEAS